MSQHFTLSFFKSFFLRVDEQPLAGHASGGPEQGGLYDPGSCLYLQQVHKRQVTFLRAMWRPLRSILCDPGSCLYLHQEM